MKPSFKIFAASMACTFMSYAQQPVTGGATQKPTKSCGSEVPPLQWEKWFSEKVLEHQSQQQISKGQAAGHTIPVIVHVIHSGEAVGMYPNLSAAQIKSQITTLNNDFAGTGLNVSMVPAAFATLVANCNITFSLALFDTTGNFLDEPGIDRINYVANGWSSPTLPTNSAAFQTYFNNTIKPNTIWDPRHYLNIWVSDKNGVVDMLGYATFPAGSGLSGMFGGGTASDDGIWVWGKAFGNTGTLDGTYNQGRTATHELGHWLGLRHINGDATCGNDFCADTPQSQNLNGGCPFYPLITCNNWPTGEMFMNFMDYCDDPCMYMFTHDQNSRMQTALTNGIYRKDLTASSATLCSYVATMPEVSFSADINGCLQYGAYITNESTGFPQPTYSWSAIPAAGVSFSPSATVKDPAITVLYPGNYQIIVAATNEAGTTTDSQFFGFADCNNATGLQQENTEGNLLQIIPNPANNVLTISFSAEKNRNGDLMIKNMLGQTVYKERLSAGKDEININCSDMAEGLYSVSVYNEGRAEVKRLIISR